MKALLAASAALLVAALLVPASPAEAQQCMKWVQFCDGIQIDSIVGNQIEAQWYHFDCANNTPMTLGLIARGDVVPNACPGGPGRAVITCQSHQGCPVGDFFWVIDSPLDGTVDMNIGNPLGEFSCWIDELPYNLQIGACTGAPQRSARPMPEVSSIQ